MVLCNYCLQQIFQAVGCSPRRMAVGRRSLPAATHLRYLIEAPFVLAQDAPVVMVQVEQRQGARPRASFNSSCKNWLMTSHSNYIHDRPATEDSLGRVHFADALSRSLILPKGSPGLVVGIEGSWGSGKSTLIGFITKSLSEVTAGNEPVVVEFNPWLVSNTGALVEALIGQVAASVGKNFPDGKTGVKVSQKLLGYVGLLKNLKYVPGLSWAGHAAEDLPDIMKAIATVAEEGTEAGKKALGEFEKLLPSWDISKKRKEVVEALEELDRPIVIVIDDLDRLPAEEIRAMIQAIKAVADFPRTTYLLAYDRDVVATALAADKDSGLSYLEKIVQVAYPIPPLSQRQLKHFANDKVRALLKVLGITLRVYEEERYERALSLLTKLARHPRDVVRTLNRLTLSLPATHGEVNAADVIVFEALSQRFPALRDAIHNHSTDFIGHSFRDDGIDEMSDIDWAEYVADKKDDSVQPWLKHLPQNEHDQRISKKSCLFLFTPQVNGSERVLSEDYLGIADPDRLARLFRMTSIEEVPEAKEMHKLLQNPDDLKHALHGDEQLLFLIEWLINYAPSCPAPNVDGCIKELADISEELTTQCKLLDDVAKKIAVLIEKLLRHKTPGYENCFLNVARNASLSVSEKVVLEAESELGKWGESHQNKVRDSLQLIPNSKIVDQSIQIWLKRVRDSVDQGNLYKEANLISVLYRFAQLNNDAYDDTYDAISKMCRTDEGLAAFLKYFEEGSHFIGDKLKIVEDAEKLAQRITHSILKDKYSWLVKLLGEENTIKFIQEQTVKHKQTHSGSHSERGAEQ